MLHDNAKDIGMNQPADTNDLPCAYARRVAGARSVLLVFAINVQCAASFVALQLDAYAPSFEWRACRAPRRAEASASRSS